MIENVEILSMAEVPEILKKVGAQEESKDLITHIGKYVQIKPEKARELRTKIKNLEILKVKEEHIAKIIDTLPEDDTDLNKIFVDVSLDEDETKKLLNTIKEYI